MAIPAFIRSSHILSQDSDTPRLIVRTVCPLRSTSVMIGRLAEKSKRKHAKNIDN